MCLLNEWGFILSVHRDLSGRGLSDLGSISTEAVLRVKRNLLGIA